MAVTFREVVHDSAFKFLDIGEMSGSQHLAFQWREDDLHLIQPGGVDRQPVETDVEGKFQRPDPSADLFGRMGGAVVEDQMQHPNSFGPEAPEDHLEEVLELHEPFAREAARDRLSGVDEQSSEQMQDSLANVAGSMAHRLAGLGGIDPAGGGPGLHAGLLIRTDDDLSPSSQRLGFLVEIQHDGRLLEELRVGRLLPRVALPGLDFFFPEPVANGGGGNA